MTKRIKLFLEGWAELTHVFEATVVDNLAATAPWLAPLAPAYIAFQSMIAQLQFNMWVAVAVATAIEMLGISTISTTVTFYNYNHDRHQRHKDDPTAPTLLAGSMAGLYLIVVIVVNVILDTSNVVERTAKGLLSVLTLIAAVTLVLRASHRQRVDEVQKVRAEEKAGREERKLLKLSGQIPDAGGKKAQDAEGPRYEDWRQLPPAEQVRINELAGRLSKKAAMKEIRRLYGVKERTAYNWIRNSLRGGMHVAEAE